MSWHKKVQLATRGGESEYAIIQTFKDEDGPIILLSTGREYEDTNDTDEPVAMTANMAGDLAHALEEAIQHMKELSDV